MRLLRLLRRLAALATVLALTWFFAPSAVAGGPTSVLITSPQSEEAAALYYANEDYGSLQALLGVDGGRQPGTGRSERPPSLEEAAGMRALNVVWMVHDIQPWRLDQVYVGKNADRPIWIHTSLDAETQQGTWHKAATPRVLYELLAKLGVLGRTVHDSDGSNLPPESDPVQGAGAAAQPAAEEPDPAGREDRAGAGAAGWWWAIPALAVGAALGPALRPVLAARLSHPLSGRRGSERESGPRRQLIDS
ncbi:hypothetical protein [Streptomyces sp. NPDC002187]|uniref:hypothetical protein n=1 Tax=Streptomyces sp. NPDC002187 TaxID=3364637 RepID=UPI0036C24463